MQNAEIYSEVSLSTEKMRSVLGLLEGERSLMTWQMTEVPEVVLDAGCGPGDVTATVLLPWLPAGSILLGVDVSPAMVGYARRRHQTATAPGLAFAAADLSEEADMRALLDDPPYRKGFTKIVSFFVLHWLHDLQLGVSNLHGLLRPGGEALLAFPVDRLFQRTFAHMRTSQRWRDHFEGVDRIIPSFPKKDAASEFKEMLCTSGFEVVKCNVDYYSTEFETIGKFRDLVESLDPDLERVPSHLKEDYLTDCVQNFKSLGALKTVGHTCTLSQLFLTCVARKP